MLYNIYIGSYFEIPGISNCSRPDVSVMDAGFGVQHFRNKDEPEPVISYVVPFVQHVLVLLPPSNMVMWVVTFARYSLSHSYQS